MVKTLQTLGDHFSKPKILETRKALDLPTELWYIVLELAIRPAIITNLEFEPRQIDLAYKSLTEQSYGDSRTTKATVFKTSRPLRAVCSLWKNIIDEIYSSTRWVVDSSQRLSSIESKYSLTSYESPSTNTRNCLRLNHTVILNKTKTPMKIRYTHSVPFLSLSIRGNRQAEMIFLRDSVPFSDQLDVFNLHFDGDQGANGLLKEIQIALSTLTTLGLTLHDRLINESLVFPTVVTFCLTFLSSNSIGQASTSEVQWEFPMLHNLALADGASNRSYFPTLHPFFAQLIRDHANSIRSLHIEPPAREVFLAAYSPICWLSLRKLNALAANFERTYIKDSSLLHGQKSSSIRHLIHKVEYLESKDMGVSMRYCIKACPSLETVTLALRVPNKSLQSTIRIYRQICKEHGVKLLDENGVDIS
ncbi:hypothetical protein CPB86DRAFT_790822 [Serendipita vermifera]|nr:hypothetical protein CPB86DRAFT_790822 [Serendipita vermifera]